MKYLPLGRAERHEQLIDRTTAACFQRVAPIYFLLDDVEYLPPGRAERHEQLIDRSTAACFQRVVTIFFLLDDVEYLPPGRAERHEQLIDRTTAACFSEWQLFFLVGRYEIFATRQSRAALSEVII